MIPHGLFTFTVWIQDDGGYLGPGCRRAVIKRLPGRVDQPNHEDLKAYVIRQTRVSSPAASVEFGPISYVGRNMPAAVLVDAH